VNFIHSCQWVYSSRSTIEIALAVNSTLAKITILVIIEVIDHYLKEPSSHLIIYGGIYTESILILALIIYEWIPTIFRLKRFEGVEFYMKIEKHAKGIFAIIGFLACVGSIGYGWFSGIIDWKKMTQDADEFGILFIIPVLGVGEAFLIACGILDGVFASFITSLPIVILSYIHLDNLTFTIYLTTVLSFFANEIFGCCHFLKQRHSAFEQLKEYP